MLLKVCVFGFFVLLCESYCPLKGQAAENEASGDRGRSRSVLIMRVCLPEVIDWYWCVTTGACHHLPTNAGGTITPEDSYSSFDPQCQRSGPCSQVWPTCRSHLCSQVYFTKPALNLLSITLSFSAYLIISTHYPACICGVCWNFTLSIYRLCLCIFMNADLSLSNQALLIYYIYNYK